MRRREFITLLGGAAAWPVTARAQQGEGVRRVGALIPLARDDPEAQAWVAAFDGSLRALGWIDGRNARLDLRWADGEFDQMQILAKDLIALRPEVVLAVGGAPGLRALLQETRTIPIVFTGVSDPVGLGFVESLARPGGNATGFSIYESSVGSKWVEMLKRVAPQVGRIALVFNPQTSSTALYLSTIEAAATSLAMELVKVPVRDSAELEAAIATFGREPGNGLMFPPDNFLIAHRALIAVLAARYRLPAVYPGRWQVAEGGLISYGVDVVEMLRQAAGYVDRILKGAKPSELPVQQPTKFELIINLKTAKALGLTIPPSVLAIADEVIE
jgi:putative ABC transport system substrate-binding protein